MTIGKNPWGGREDRQFHYDDKIRSEKRANYGFQKIPEAEKSSRVRDHFNSVARQYDFMNTVLSLGIHYLWKRAAVKQLDLSPGERVLDVCGGTGDLAVLAKRAVGPEGRVVVYDINRAMIDAGRRKRSCNALRSGLLYAQGDAESIAFADGSFDAVMVGFGIRNVTHMTQAFREMTRVLKGGGRLLCLEFSKPANPLFRWLYDLYSFHAMPVLGQLLAGTRQAYTHLPESIRMFPLPVELKQILESIGLSGVTWRPLTNGVAVVHLGIKPC